MIKINKKLLALLLVAALLVGAGSVVLLAGNGVGGVHLYSSEDAEMLEHSTQKYAKLDYLMSTIKELYYTDVDEDALLEGAYAGAFEALNDPYSEYVKSDDTEAFMNQVLGTFFGVGMTFQEVEEPSLVIASITISITLALNCSFFILYFSLSVYFFF